MYEELTYSVRRSDRARRVRVTVDPRDGVEVVLPRRAPARAAAAAVAELRPWIEGAVGRGGGAGGGRRAAPVDRAAARRGRRAAPAARGPRRQRALPRRRAAPPAPTRAHARAPARRRAARPGGGGPRGGDRALVPAGRARRDRAAGRARRGGGRAPVHGADDSRPAHAVGLVLVDGRAELQLAAAARARGGARLRDIARGGTTP